MESAVRDVPTSVGIAESVERSRSQSVDGEHPNNVVAQAMHLLPGSRAGDVLRSCWQSMLEERLPEMHNLSSG